MGSNQAYDIEGASDLMISQFPPILIDAIDSFYNNQGDICATKLIQKLTLLLVIWKLALLLLRIMNGTVQNLL